MNRIKAFTVGFSLALLCLAFQSSAFAWGSVRKAVVTIEAPLEVPGFHNSVIIGPGTYVFKNVAEPYTDDRKLVQVFNEDQTQLLTTFWIVPDYRIETTDRSIVRFAETSPDSPREIKELFFPGEPFGWEFVYPNSGVAQSSNANIQNAPTTSAASEEPTTPESGGR